MTDLKATEWIAEQAVHNVEVAVLDVAGIIVATNDSWEAFCLFNGGDPTRTGVGVSYLEVCSRAGDDEYAVTVAALVRAALDGGLASATSLVIPCHSSTHQRWFELFISPREDDDGGRLGATIVLVPVGRPRPQSLVPPSVITREDQIQELHHAVIDRLHAAGLRLNEFADQSGLWQSAEHIAAALGELDAAIASLRRDALMSATAAAPTQTA